MARHLTTVIILLVSCTSAVLAADQCKDILTGLMSYRTTLNDVSFERQYINWLNTNEYASSQSAQNASLNLGLKVPVEGVPVDFTGKFARGEYGSQSYSKALASYLSDHTVERKSFFQKIREANPDVVKAWSDCQSLRLKSRGMYCSINQGQNPNEIELYIEFIPFGGDLAQLEITELVTLPKEVLSPEENYLHKSFTTEGMTLVFKRNNDLGGRVKLKTNNIRYECGSGDELKFIPVVREPPQQPTREVTEGIASMRFDKTCNCFQHRTQLLLPKPADTGFQGVGDPATYRGRACLEIEQGSLSDVEFQAEITFRDNPHIPCGSEARKGIQSGRSACWTFEMSINSNEAQCDYHWLIVGKKIK